MSIIGRDNATREDIENAIVHRVLKGRNPSDFKVKITNWRGRGIEENRNDLWGALHAFYRDSDVDHAEKRALDPGELRDWESESEDEE